MNPAEVAEFLKSKVLLFAGFPEIKLKELIVGSRISTFEPHEAIINFGEEGRFLGVILEGNAEACRTDDGGQKHHLGKLKEGDIFGEMSLMTGDRTMADIVCTSRCKAILIPSGLFSTLLITHAPAITSLAKTITERLKRRAQAEEERKIAASAFKHSDDPYGFKLRTDSPKKLLVINCGSSSLKYNFFDTFDESKNARGVVEKIGEQGTRHTHYSPKDQIVKEMLTGTHREAFNVMVKALTAKGTGVMASPSEVFAIGHRVVHGGSKYNDSVVISDEVVTDLDKISDLAPLHNPVNLIGVREAKILFSQAHHVAVFDTAFHQTIPAYAHLYGLPYDYYERRQIRRYGFHGTSHHYVSLRAAEFMKRPYNELEMIVCHLGNGASVCAVDHGRSIDTSMGLTPAEGLIMGTRCGDIDPAILIHLMRTDGFGYKELDTLVNKQSGLKGLSGVTNDMREIEKLSEGGHHQALLAFKTFSYRIRKYIGAYVAAMGGLNVLVFTGGIGQGSAGVRSLACQGLQYMGIEVDESKNVSARGFEDICEISVPGARVKVLVVPTNEELMIARETLRTVNAQHVTKIIHSQKPMPIPIEVSAHHVHLSRADVDALFGKEYKLTPEFELSQPGQFACKETVNLVGPKGKVDRVRVLGPERRESQVEISMTEQFKLGVAPPIRASGDIDDSPGITLETAAGKSMLGKGVICALRHVHMTPEDALHFGLHDKDMVMVQVQGKRTLVFGDVLVRIDPNFRLFMHLDTDEANAAGIKTGVTGFIDRIQSRG